MMTTASIDLNLDVSSGGLAAEAPVGGVPVGGADGAAFSSRPDVQAVAAFERALAGPISENAALTREIQKAVASLDAAFPRCAAVPPCEASSLPSAPVAAGLTRSHGETEVLGESLSARAQSEADLKIVPQAQARPRCDICAEPQRVQGCLDTGKPVSKVSIPSPLPSSAPAPSADSAALREPSPRPLSGPVPTVSGALSGPVPTVSVNLSGPVPTVSVALAGPVPTATGPVPTVSAALSGPVPAAAGPVPTVSVNLSGPVPTAAGPVPTVSGALSGPVPTVSVALAGPVPTATGPVPTATGPVPTVSVPTVAGPVPTVSGELAGSVPHAMEEDVSEEAVVAADVAPQAVSQPVVPSPVAPLAPEAPAVTPVEIVRTQAAQPLPPAQVLVEAAQAVADTLLVSPGLLRGQGEVVVRLRPDVLEGTEVRIAVTGRQLDVQFQPTTVDMAVLLENCRTQIANHLTAKIATFNVTVDVRKKRV